MTIFRRTCRAVNDRKTDRYEADSITHLKRVRGHTHKRRFPRMPGYHHQGNPLTASYTSDTMASGNPYRCRPHLWSFLAQVWKQAHLCWLWNLIGRNRRSPQGSCSLQARRMFCILSSRLLCLSGRFGLLFGTISCERPARHRLQPEHPTQ